VSPASTVDWIALNLLPGVGPVGARAALKRFGSPGEVAHRAPPSVFRGLPRFRESGVEAVRIARRNLARRAERELRECDRLGIRVLTLDRPDYPAALREFPDGPLVLYVRGRLREGVLRVAVVGSRRPTGYGRTVATGLGSGLAAREIEVVSGGALGIDTAAHRGALAEDGVTTAVLGTGLARPYPGENAGLFDRIAETGAVVSEFSLDSGPTPDAFPRRNRIVSGLSAAVVVVEAASRSGALITAAHALDQGREVLAVPGPVSSPASAGANRLIQQGAKLVQNIEDILDELPPLFRVAAGEDPAGPEGRAPGNFEGLTGDEREVVCMLDPVEPVQLDDLAERAPFGIARLQTALFGLEIRRAVERRPGKYYLLRPL